MQRFFERGFLGWLHPVLLLSARSRRSKLSRTSFFGSRQTPSNAWDIKTLCQSVDAINFQKRLDMRTLRCLQERIILGAAIFAFLLLWLVKSRFPVFSCFDGTVFATFLRSDVTAGITEDLLTGIISAYIFYIAVDLIPRHRRHQSTLIILNLLVASIVDAYERGRIFGHETPIKSVDFVVLKESSLKKHAEDVKLPSINFLKLKCSMETAHSRYPDFQNSLGLAAGLSPEHALEWLVLCDKVRLLADVYESELACLSAEDVQSMEDRRRTLQLRVMEVMEVFAGWVKFTSS